MYLTSYNDYLTGFREPCSPPLRCHTGLKTARSDLCINLWVFQGTRTLHWCGLAVQEYDVVYACQTLHCTRKRGVSDICDSLTRSRVDQHSLHLFLLVHPLLYFLPLLLSVSLLSPEQDEWSKALECYCFPVFRLIGEYVFLDLFHLVVDMSYQHLQSTPNVTEVDYFKIQDVVYAC